jgi:hypothetical protein
MWRVLSCAALAAMTAMLALPAHAADDDIAKLRAEIDALKSDYDARIVALESRITQLEAAQMLAAPSDAAVAQAPPTAGAPEAPPVGGGYSPPPASTEGSAATARSGLAAFNPATSVILTGNYVDLSKDPATWRMAGFIPSGGDVGPGERSFNVGESELTLSANVDPYFFGNVTAAIDSDGEIGIEEAYFRTTALRHGLTMKGGRFFSGVGYLNEIHAHAWDFIDQPLVYQAFLDGQLEQDGLQVKWLAPTVLFVELGLEGANGDAFPGTRRDRNGVETTALFAHVGSDIGDSTSWRAGVSWLHAHVDDRTFDDVDRFGAPVVDAFTGTSRTWIADAVLKWAPHGNPTQHALKLQGEYMQRTERGDLAFDTLGLGLSDDYRNRQSGWYVQGVYQFIPRWRAGLRYDALDADGARLGLVENGTLAPEDFPALLPGSPDRFSVMVDWSPSEFSRLRAQYALDQARADDEEDRQIFLQYIYSLGAHGAHKF